MKKIIISFLAILVLFMTTGAMKASAATNPISITTSSDKVLFELTNLKPGDWAERKITVQNRGNADFNYVTNAKRTAGSEKLYNEFLLKIVASDGILYEGNLSDFTGLDARYLKEEHEEELEFYVEFPRELGNEFQGLEFEMELQFSAEEVVSNTPEEAEPPIDQENQQTPIARDDLSNGLGNNEVLPSTSTNTFNYLFLGLLVTLIGVSIYVIHRTRHNRTEEV